MKHKFSINHLILAFASLLLAAVLLSGCSAETKQEMTMWWNQLANKLRNKLNESTYSGYDPWWKHAGP